MGQQNVQKGPTGNDAQQGRYQDLAGNAQSAGGQNQANLNDLGHTGPKDGDEGLTTDEQHTEMSQRQNRSQQQGNSQQMNSGRKDR